MKLKNWSDLKVETKRSAFQHQSVSVLVWGTEEEDTAMETNSFTLFDVIFSTNDDHFTSY